MKKLLCILLCSLSCAAMQTPLRFTTFIFTPITPPTILTGSIAVTIDGGVAPYTYQVADEEFETSEQGITVDGLDAGQYIVRVFDSNEGSIEATVRVVDITQESILVNDIFIENVTSCNATNGSLSISALSETTSPEFSITGPEGPFQPNGVFENLAPGTYSIVVRPTEGTNPDDVWPGTVPLILTIALPMISVQTTPADCISGKGGTITIDATGGVPPYRYSIDGGKTFSTGSRFTNVAPGTYQIKVVDSNQCSTSTQAIVGQERATSDNAITNFISEKFCDGKCSS